jgi:hypothetical protein
MRSNAPAPAPPLGLNLPLINHRWASGVGKKYQTACYIFIAITNLSAVGWTAIRGRMKNDPDAKGRCGVSHDTNGTVIHDWTDAVRTVIIALVDASSHLRNHLLYYRSWTARWPEVVAESRRRVTASPREGV